MYHSGEAQTSPTLTSSDSINRCRPEYLMDEITSNAVTRSQKLRPVPPRQLHPAHLATIAEYQLETLGVITELSQSIVKSNNTTHK